MKIYCANFYLSVLFCWLIAHNISIVYRKRKKQFIHSFIHSRRCLAVSTHPLCIVSVTTEHSDSLRPGGGLPKGPPLLLSLWDTPFSSWSRTQTHTCWHWSSRVAQRRLHNRTHLPLPLAVLGGAIGDVRVFHVLLLVFSGRRGGGG